MPIAFATQKPGRSPGGHPPALRLMMVGPTGVAAMQRPVNWLLAEGHEVMLVDYSNWHLDPLPNHGSFAPFYPPRAEGLLEWRKKLRATVVAKWVIARHLRNLADRFRPHIVHAHGMSFRTECCVAAHLKPLVVSAWGALNFLLTPDSAGDSPRKVYRIVTACDALIVEAPSLVAATARFAGRPLRIDLVALGVDGELFRPGAGSRPAAWRFALKIPDDAAVVLSPRGWGEVYNQDLILEAFAAAYPRFHRPVVLAFVALGRSPKALAYFQRCQRRARELGIQQALRVFPVLPQAEMPGLYAMADVVVNYPSADAFPSTLLEAVACERPVITSRLPSYRGTFIDECLTLVEPDNPSALAEAMIEAINSPASDAQTRLEDARRTVLTRHSENRALEQLVQIYRDLSAG